MELSNNITEFFNNYILNYGPYKDNILYQKILKNIFEYYTLDSYTIIPNILQSIFEKQNIPIILYDKILISLGLSKIVIDKLSLNDKLIIISTMSDFQRYKGSIELIKKLSTNFNDDIEIGELFLDYDYYSDPNQKEWMFKAKCLTDETKPILKFDFDEIYNSIPSFLLSKQSLTESYENNNIILPIKSNLIYLDITKCTYLDGLTDFVTQYFLYKYGNLNIPVYIEDKIFHITFKHLIIIWYYLLNKSHNIEFPNNINIDIAISFNTLNNTDINNIDKIITNYLSISNANESEQFYNQYFSKYIKRIIPTKSMSIIEMENYINVYIGNEFLDFINDYVINNIQDVKTSYFNILTQLYDSIILFNLESNDNDFNKYLTYYLNSLSYSILNINSSNVYLILSNLKPYHTEIVNNINNIIRVNDKMNTINPIDKNNILYNLVRSDYQDFVDYNLVNISLRKLSNNDIIDEHLIKILIQKEEEYNLIISDIYISSCNLLKHDIQDYSDFNYYNVDIFKFNNTSFLDSNILKINSKQDSEFFINEQLNLIFPVGTKSTIFNINELMKIDIDVNNIDYMLLMSNYNIYQKYLYSINYNNILTEQIDQDNKNPSYDLYNIKEFFNIF